MLTSPSAEWTTYEGLSIGATPSIRISILSYHWPNGVNDNGSFIHTYFLIPDRIESFDTVEGDGQPFTGGIWESETIQSNIQVASSPAVLTWDWNCPGFTMTLYFRGAATAAELVTASYTAVSQGGSINITPYYQFKLTLEAYRAWAYDSAPNSFTAYATDSPGDTTNPLQGYACDVNHSKDRDTYIEDVELLGEFTLAEDIEEAGSITLEVPKSFDELVAGSYDGLLLNNRQMDGITPAPLYSPSKSSFFLTGQEWYGKMIKVALGWYKGGASPWFDRDWTDFLTLYQGVISKWGPAGIGVDDDGAVGDVTVEVYAEDFITKKLNQRICLPNADGSPNPYIAGEFLLKAERVVGWSPASVMKSAYFENNNYNELDQLVVGNGGTFEIVTPGITGNHAFRTVADATDTAQYAYGAIAASSSSEIFITGSIRFSVVPATYIDKNTKFLKIVNSSGSSQLYLAINSDGTIYCSLGGNTEFNIAGYTEVPLSFGVWFKAATNGFVKIFINGDEVLSYAGDLAAYSIDKVRLGVDVTTSETWTIDFDDIEIRSKYYDQAFQVAGWPFDNIGPVYVDNVAQPDSKVVGSYTQTLTKYPQYGMVQFNSPDLSPSPGYDPDFNLSGEVLIRAIEHVVGRHPLAVIEDLIDLAGLSSYVHATALAAAYAAVPNDICHCHFEGGKRENRFGLNDIANLGIPIMDCLIEICSRYLYWIFVDAGQIKIVPYTGTPPSGSVKTLTSADLYEAQQTLDLESISDFVTAIYGWNSRNPSLFYVAGTQETGGEGQGLDFTWDSPVCCEDRAIVKSKADLLLKFLSVHERLEPVRMNLAGARLELLDPVSVNIPTLHDTITNYWVTRKEISLNPDDYTVSLQLMRYQGET